MKSLKKIFSYLIKKTYWTFVLKIYAFNINIFTKNRKIYPINYPFQINQFYSNNNSDSKYNEKLLLPYCDLNMLDRQKLTFPFECLEVERIQKNNSKIINFKSSNFIVLPIACVQNNFNNKTKEFKLNIEFSGEKKKLQMNYLNRFHYLPIKNNKKFANIKVTPKNFDLILGKPIINDSNNNRLVFHILLDAVPQVLIEDYGYILMPNTFKFLNGKGIVFENTFAQSEWTLSSMASVFTGKYTNEHLLYKPRSTDKIIDKTIAQKLSENDFKTFGCSNVPKLNPISGFDKGFDRFIHAQENDAQFIINEAIEQLRSFNGKQYIFLGLFETHEAHKLQPLSVQTSTDLDNFYFRNLNGSSKSIKANYDKERINFLKGCLQNVDSKLKQLFEEINKYDENAIFVLHSDHGVNFMSRNEGLLAKEREKVLFIYKNNENIVYEKKITEIRKVSQLIFKDLKIDNFLEEKALGHAITESIYPNKDYEIAVRSDKYVLFFNITWHELKNKSMRNFKSSFHDVENEDVIFQNSGKEYKRLLDIAMEHCIKTFQNLG